jgi:N4-(beta-N-acetylglucosaminyl)-L-asparaginase
MRQGKSPQEACKLAVERVIERNLGNKDFQVAVVALNKNGETGGYAIHDGFSYMVNAGGKNENVKSAFFTA